MEELRVKIEENERVHMEMFEMKKQFESSKGAVEKALEDQQKRTKELVDECVRKDTSLKRLMSDKESLLCEKDRLSKELNYSVQTATKTQEQMKSINEELTTELAYQRDRFSGKILFDDTKNSKVNVLNIPPCDAAAARRNLAEAKKVIDVFVSNHFVHHK